MLSLPIIGPAPKLVVVRPLRPYMGSTLLHLLISFHFALTTKVSYEAEVRVKEIKKLHEQIIAHIEKIIEAYRTKANKNIKGG